MFSIAAMEDNKRRMQRRIDKLLATFSVVWPERLDARQCLAPARQGRRGRFADGRRTSPSARLVILDTLAGVKPIKTAWLCRGLRSLGGIASPRKRDSGVALVLHHTRKMEAEDPVDTVSGTLGLAGCADTVLVLARSSQGTTLYVRGRDIEEAEHAVTLRQGRLPMDHPGQRRDVTAPTSEAASWPCWRRPPRR